MTSKARNLVLTKSQAACLIALRRRKDSKPEIAIQAKLDLTKTATELRALARIGACQAKPIEKVADDHERESMSLQDRSGSTAA